MSKIRLDPNDDRPFDDDEQDAKPQSKEQKPPKEQKSEDTKS